MINPTDRTNLTTPTPVAELESEEVGIIAAYDRLTWRLKTTALFYALHHRRLTRDLT